MRAFRAHRPTADVALLQLEAPPNGKNAADLGVPQIPIVAGSRFTIAGIGVAIRGEGKSGGGTSAPGPAPASPPRTFSTPPCHADGDRRNQRGGAPSRQF